MEHSEHIYSSQYPPIDLDSWQWLVDLTGLGNPHPITGWDRLIQALFETPSAQLRTGRRIAAINALFRALSQLREREFAVIVLRYGLTADDHPIPARSRRDVSMMLELSHSRIAQLDNSGLDSLREYFGDSLALLKPLVNLPS